MAKLFATEMAWRAVDQAVQLHGGYGVVKGMTVERLYRAIRQPRVYEGTSEIQNLYKETKSIRRATYEL